MLVSIQTESGEDLGRKQFDSAPLIGDGFMQNYYMYYVTKRLWDSDGHLIIIVDDGAGA